MVGISSYIYHKNQPNVGKYTIPMDPVGMKSFMGIYGPYLGDDGLTCLGGWLPYDFHDIIGFSWTPAKKRPKRIPFSHPS